MTNKELILTIIEIQGKLTRYGMGVHEHWHETLNEVIDRLKMQRDCQNCINYKNNNGIYSCQKWECDFEPKRKEK